MIQQEAQDAILTTLAAGIDLTSSGAQWVWPDTPEDTNKDLPRIEISFDAMGGDHTLGEEGYRFFQRDELLLVMVKSPVSFDRTKFDPKKVANSVKDLFEGKHLNEGVWFNECLVRPLGRVDTDIVYAVWCDYSYQEQK